MVRYDPYTDSFIDDLIKETTATSSLDAFPKDAVLVQMVEVSDESIEKIADAVVQKLADRKTEQSNSEKPNDCDYAVNPSGDAWECSCYQTTLCEHQKEDFNPDGTINIVECKTEQTERSE